MRGTPSVWRRTRRLEAMMTRVDLQAEVARLAAEVDIPPEQLWAEAATLAGRFARGRWCDRRALCDELAAERGLDPAAVWRETERSLAGWGR